MEYKSHLKGLSNFVLAILLLSGCQKNNYPLKDILTKDSYSRYSKMTEFEKSQLEKSIWYFYMFKDDYFFISCNTEVPYERGTFNLQDFRLLIDRIEIMSDTSRYFFFFQNDSLTCTTLRGGIGVEWINGWPFNISKITDDFDTVAFKQRTQDYTLMVQEKFKDGPLKKWLLENKPY